MPEQIQLRIGLAGKADMTWREHAPKRILILAECSGQAGGKDELGPRRIHSVDVDSLDELLAQFASRIRISLTEEEASGIVLEFEHHEDFHPDALFMRIPVFGALRTMRKRLENPATFAAPAE